MYTTLMELKDSLQGIVKIKEQELQILDENTLRTSLVDDIIFSAIFHKNNEIVQATKWIIKEAGRKLGIIPSSIQELYEARGKGEIEGFTVPAINIRTLTYDVARAVLRVAIHLHVGALIFELARSEMGYTAQSPSEYASAVIAAAIKERFSGPLFLQGDHFQFNRQNFIETPQTEFDALKHLIQEAIEAQFYNIDIDASTLVDLQRNTILDQQRPNFTATAELLQFTRALEPDAITISVGGEIGEIGGQNSTSTELRAYLTGLQQTLDIKNKKLPSVSKISVQTGTHHGGVVLPDGTLAQVKIDFGTLEQLSKVAREEFNLCGVVQHGASTLPDEAFHKFPETETAEIHLATGFQNIIYDSKHFPIDLRNQIYAFLKENFKHERKTEQTDEQFLYKIRKRALGPFKEEIWNLPIEAKERIGEELEAKFRFLFKQLRVTGTKKLVSETITPIEIPMTPPKSINTLIY
ncbi:MAG: class II fructose-bisphosphate aldolase [Candidatus Heimdallarchaeota archaeon]